MDAGDIGGERGRKGDALLTPPRGPGLPSSSSPPSPGSGLFLPSDAAAAAVLALPVSRDPAASPGAGFLAAPRLAGAMDGGGEALLVRRSKAKKRPAAAAAAPAERDYGAVDRFRSLFRDYNDLLEETEAKRKRLASANRRKFAILAEVKFLRRKYGSFVKGNLQKTHYKLKKKQARYVPSPLGRASVFADHDAAGTEGPSSSRNPNLDLNQGSIMNDEGNDCQGHQGHLDDKFDQLRVDEEMIAADVKLSVCRDAGNSSASDEKRPIDRLALQA